jgi:predicted nucleic acid-binding Zn ribbon protein
MERAGRLISKLKLPPGSVSLEDLARAGWPAAVGQRIAAHARAVSLAGNRLIVEVEDVVWQRQLFVLRKKILKRLEEILGRSVVADVDFRMVPRRRQPQSAEAPRTLEKDDANQIQDPVLRAIYKEKRGRRSA